VDHKVTNRELNSILGIDHVKTIVGQGLSVPQIRTVADHYRLNPLAADFLALPTVDYAEWCYPLVESGYPVLLVFLPTHAVGHIVPVVGHTMNSDKWDCAAHLAYRPEAFGTHHASATWVDHFIIHDDNFGMYTCMPPSYLRSRILPQFDSTQRASFGMAFLPAGLDVPPFFAEKAAVQRVRDSLGDKAAALPYNLWMSRISRQLGYRNKGLVARTLQCSKQDYISRLQGVVDSDGKRLAGPIPRALATAPEHLWLTEISLPDLYTANKHKLGDVLTNAKATEQRGQKLLNFVWAWLPGMQMTANSLPNRPPLAWPLTGHIPLFRRGDVLGPYQEW
jgi:hypothetical protein